MIQKDPESHVVGAFLNWRYVPTGAERAAWDIQEMTFNSKRKKGTIPIKLPRPWQGVAPVLEQKLVAPDAPDRLAAIERLKANS